MFAEKRVSSHMSAILHGDRLPQTRLRRTPCGGSGVFKAAGLLDERVDEVAATARRMSAIRMPVTLASAVLTGVMFNAFVGAAWGGLYLALEAATVITSAPSAAGRAMSPGRRIAYLSAVFGQGLAWCALAVLFWTQPEGPYRLAAMTMLAGVLVHAQGFSYRSPPTLILIGAPPSILWLVL